MSDALTNAAAAALIAARKLKGIKGPLLLLKHAPGDSDDYSTIGKLTSGFLIATTTEGIELRICESPTATPALLRDMNGCSFGEKAFKIKGSDKVQPLGAPLLWRFLLTPTGEPYR